MTDTSPNLSLPYILAAQAQKHVTHNESIRALDAIVQIAVLDRDLAAPPPSPTDGDRYVVGTGATGAWQGADGQIAAWQDGAWIFYPPRTGWCAWVADERTALVFDGSDWIALSADVSDLQEVAHVGINTTADDTNRFAAKSDAALFSHDDVTPGTGDMRVNVNKSASNKTASFVFQKEFSGCAEIGLTGDDDFHFKVSPDGSAWLDALLLIGATGTPRIPVFTTATLPSASAAGLGGLVMVSDAPDGAELAYSDGSIWRRVHDRVQLGQVVWMFVVVGESNAAGAALDNAGPTVGELAARTGTKILNNTTLAFGDLDIGTNNNIDQNLPESAVHGWELSLANMVDAGRFSATPVYIVKTGQSGARVANWAVGQTYWTKFLARVGAAKTALEAAGLLPRPVVLFSMGGNDAKSPVTAVSTWKADTIALLARIRTELGATTPIIMSNFEFRASQYQIYDASMLEIAAADSNTKIVSSLGTSIRSDNLHWDYGGLLEMGERMINQVLTGAAPSTPTFSPAAGTYTSSQVVTIASSAGAAIRYTTNGSDPTSNSPLCTGPVTVAASQTLKPRRFKQDAQSSAVGSAAYTINGAVATPMFSPAAGSYKGTQTLTISCATLGATIYYTTNGTDPTTGSTLYTGPISVPST